MSGLWRRSRHDSLEPSSPLRAGHLQYHSNRGCQASPSSAHARTAPWSAKVGDEAFGLGTGVDASLHGSERGADAGLEFVERRSERQEVALDDSRKDSQEHQPAKSFSDAIGHGGEIVKGLELVMVEAKQRLERAGPMPGLSRTFVVIHATRARMTKTS